MENEVFAHPDSGIDIGREGDEFSTFATVSDQKEAKKFLKIFGFKIAMTGHGFLNDGQMRRKYYLITCTVLDYDNEKIETFKMALSKQDCTSRENFKTALEKVSDAHDGMFHFCLVCSNQNTCLFFCYYSGNLPKSCIAMQGACKIHGGISKI